MMISLRALNVFLVMMCVSIVASLCVSLSIWSADRALEDTRQSMNTSVSDVSEAGRNTTLDLTAQYLKQVSRTTVGQLGDFWGVSHDFVASLCRQIDASIPRDTEAWPYLYAHRGQLYQHLMNVKELDAVGFVTTSHKVFQLFENVRTARSQGFHHINVNINNGSGYDGVTNVPAQLRTQLGDVIPDGKGSIYGWPGNTSNAEKRFCSGELGALSNGTQFEAPCEYSLHDPVETHFALAGYWGDLHPYSSHVGSMGTYVGVMTQCDFPITPTERGVVFGGTLLDKISEFMQKMDIGGNGRVFATVREEWVSKLSPLLPDTFGTLVATSHGKPFREVNNGVHNYSTTIRATDCDDLIVRSTALQLESRHPDTDERMYDAVHRQEEPFYFTLNETGEGYYVSVDIFDDGKGINWYVVSLIDRVHVLGEVDRRTLATRVEIARTEDEVTEELNRSRRLLYTLLLLCVLLPVVLSAFLVYRAAEPLLTLMKEMQMVAVMKLDQLDADASLSCLTEVREMQLSFRTMVRNLVEYREYLPQSVLCDSTDADDVSGSDSRLSPTAHSAERSPATTPHTSAPAKLSAGESISATLHLTPQARLGAFDSNLCTKSVTLIVTNMHCLHTVNVPSLADVLQRYLEPIVQTARKYRGIVDEMSGDRVTLSFNTTLPATAHRTHAVEFAHYLKGKWCEDVPVEGNIAIATGSAVCGNVGCFGLKKYGIVGNVACNVRAIERCGRAWGVTTICDGRVAADVRYKNLIRKLIQVLLKERHPSVLCEVVSAKCSTTNHEWMYSMQDEDAQDPYRITNTVVDLVYSGNVPKAKQLLQGCSAPGIEATRSLLDLAMCLHKAPEPQSLFAVPLLMMSGEV